jgi:hypothetical protein
MNSQDQKNPKECERANVTADPRTAHLLSQVSERDKTALALLALELLGCLANGTDKIAKFELEEEVEQAGLGAFLDSRWDELRQLRLSEK